ncbi:MAG TPA: FAD-dependent thymidylate synthase [Cyanobacteria bacterium UBA8530]|nr:FAD-dependent thymidylate synthase [Cyanobacteria bacterium UBA8530]
MNVELIHFTPRGEELVEWAGRICYRSHHRMTGDPSKFIEGIVSRGHESVIEHWRALFFVRATEGELLDLLSSVPLLRFSRREKDFLLSGNARMFRQARGPLAEGMRKLLSGASPLLFGNGGNPLQSREPPNEKIVNEWSYFLPAELTGAELSLHGAATFYFKGVSRALTHQLVRHRMASYSQASQRYCNEENFEVVVPPSVEEKGALPLFCRAIAGIRENYRELKESGLKAEDARYLLPNATSSEIAVSMTFEHWANFLALRCDSHAQWEIRNVAHLVKGLLHERLPQSF